MAMPAATINGTITCSLCGQRVFDTEGVAWPWAEAQALVRAHQRSEVCG